MKQIFTIILVLITAASFPQCFEKVNRWGNPTVETGDLTCGICKSNMGDVFLTVAIVGLFDHIIVSFEAETHLPQTIKEGESVGITTEGDSLMLFENEGTSNAIQSADQSRYSAFVGFVIPPDKQFAFLNNRIKKVKCGLYFYDIDSYNAEILRQNFICVVGKRKY